LGLRRCLVHRLGLVLRLRRCLVHRLGLILGLRRCLVHRLGLILGLRRCLVHRLRGGHNRRDHSRGRHRLRLGHNDRDRFRNRCRFFHRLCDGFGCNNDFRNRLFHRLRFNYGFQFGHGDGHRLVKLLVFRFNCGCQFQFRNLGNGFVFYVHRQFQRHGLGNGFHFGDNILFYCRCCINRRFYLLSAAETAKTGVIVNFFATENTFHYVSTSILNRIGESSPTFFQL
jgi:hypothetical protein